MPDKVQDPNDRKVAWNGFCAKCGFQGTTREMPYRDGEVYAKRSLQRGHLVHCPTCQQTLKVVLAKPGGRLL